MQSLSLTTPFILGGTLKILYDVALYRMCKDLRPHEGAEAEPERAGRTAT
jgi:hypothetical protein